MRVFYISVAVTVVALIWIITNSGGCYPHNGPPPLSCAQDPTQSWCLPPAFATKTDCTVFRVDIDRDAGVRDPLGVWHYPARASSAPCNVDGGAR